MKSCKIHILLWNGQILLFSSKVKSLYRVRLFAIPWTVVYQAFLSMAFSRQEYWNGLPFPSPGDLPNPGIEPIEPWIGRQVLYLVARTVKRLPTLWETQVRALGLKDPLEKEMATHSSILAWKMPWTEEPERLQSMGSQRVGHD